VFKYRSCFCSYAELICPIRQRIRRRHKSKHRSVFVSTGTFTCASVLSTPPHSGHCTKTTARHALWIVFQNVRASVIYIGNHYFASFMHLFLHQHKQKRLGLPCVCLIASSISTASSIFQANIHIPFFLMVCSPLNFWLNIQGAFYVCVQFSLIFFSFSFKSSSSSSSMD